VSVAAAVVVSLLVGVASLDAGARRADPTGSYQARANWSTAASDLTNVVTDELSGQGRLKGRVLKFAGPNRDRDDLRTKGRIKFARAINPNRPDGQRVRTQRAVVQQNFASGQRDRYELDASRYVFQKNRRNKWAFRGTGRGELARRKLADGTTVRADDIIAIRFSFVSD
jgi:hypothetical protein